MRYVLSLVVLAVVGAAGFFAWAQYPAIVPIDPPARASFAAAEIARGEALAGLGDCAVCHTKAGGKSFAGGLALPTPFGIIHSTNITPDRETGIGAWSLEAFQRAMSEGISRDGHYLYPAFPYDHFTKVRPEDVKAIYAFLMTRPAVAAPAEVNGLRFPFNIRMLVSGWNLLFLDRGVFVADAGKSEEYNRGAYLVEGLGHCGACHTPRNILGAERHGSELAGGEAEDWLNPPLGSASLAPVPWTRDALVNFLIDGWDSRHGVAAGPMTAVVNLLAKQKEADITAIATYLVGRAGAPAAGKAEAAIAFANEREFQSTPATAQPSNDDRVGRGEALFARSCANCHKKGGQTVPLGLSTVLQNGDPRNVIHVILDGIKPPEGAPERSMPRFGSTFSDEQIADLLAFMRSRFSKGPAWTDVPARLKVARQAAG